MLGCVFIMWKKSCELASFRKIAMTYVGNIMLVCFMNMKEPIVNGIAVVVISHLNNALLSEKLRTVLRSKPK